MSFAADICKNAVVTDCLVLKDKKAFLRQWNARESLFEPRKDSGFQVRDLSLSLCLSHAHTQMQYLHQDDCLIIWWSKLLCLRQRKRQRDSVCWRWEWGGLQIETSSLSPGPYPSPPGLMPAGMWAGCPHHYRWFDGISLCQAWSDYVMVWVLSLDFEWEASSSQRSKNIIYPVWGKIHLRSLEGKVKLKKKLLQDCFVPVLGVPGWQPVGFWEGRQDWQSTGLDSEQGQTVRDVPPALS